MITAENLQSLFEVDLGIGVVVARWNLADAADAGEPLTTMNPTSY
jgi:hypothetical protein